jgi:gluconokinase
VKVTTEPNASTSEPPFVLAIDVGTSSVRVSGFDRRGQHVPELAVSEKHAPRITPDGGAEMDADEVLERVLRLLEALIARREPGVWAGAGVTTFWHGILGVDAAGRAVTPLYTWADTRSAAAAAELRARLDEAAVPRRTGCLLHTSYVPAKLLWLSQTDPERFRRAARWVSLGEYLFLRLFGEPFCSISMASGTGMLDQTQMKWDEELLAALPIAEEQLSPIVPLDAPARGIRGEADERLAALREVPWVPAVGDGAASNIGSGCVSPERVALMVGTSGAMRALFEAEEISPPEGLWCYRVDRRRPMIGGALSNGGNLFAWMQETLRLPDGQAVEAQLAAMEPDAHGLTMLPFLAGERAVGWRADARAAIVGLSWNTRPLDILRAGLEAVALRFARILERLRPLLPSEPTIVASGAGLLSSPAWMQMMADALGTPVVASEEAEASSRGAVLLALEALGLLPLHEAKFAFGRTFAPDPARHARYQAADARQRRLYDLLLVQSDLGSAR